MLIVAIPKSASTSLMETLGRQHSLSAKQILFKENDAPKGMQAVYKYHSDMRELDASQVDELNDKQCIYKQHIPPTANNLNLLSGVKRVVLLREPREIIDSYFREEQKNLRATRPEFESCKNLEEYREVAQTSGFLSDLKWFRDEWIKETEKNPSLTLIVNYSDLVKKPQLVINRIEEHFNLPVSTSVTLSKKRYSRHPFYIDALRNIKKKLGVS